MFIVYPFLFSLIFFSGFSHSLRLLPVLLPSFSFSFLSSARSIIIQPTHSHLLSPSSLSTSTMSSDNKAEAAARASQLEPTEAPPPAYAPGPSGSHPPPMAEMPAQQDRSAPGPAPVPGPAPGGSYPMQPYGQHQPQGTPLHALTDRQTEVVCPACNHYGVTVVDFQSGGFTHALAAVVCCFSCLGCIPYLFSRLKDVTHKCAKVWFFFFLFFFPPGFQSFSPVWLRCLLFGLASWEELKLMGPVSRFAVRYQARHISSQQFKDGNSRQVERRHLLPLLNTQDVKQITK